LHLGRWDDAQAIIERGLAIDPNYTGLKNLPRLYLPWKLKYWLRQLRFNLLH
jgi:hypothetical protein